MLIEFTVGNYKSFNQPVTLSMLATKITSKDRTVDDNNSFQIGNDLHLLTSAVIYGANASGKSNLTSAMLFMKMFVLTSSKDTQAAETIDIERFRLSTKTKEQPSFFQILFLLNGKKFKYGFEINSQEIVSEWLEYVPTIREAKLFERKNGKIHLHGPFKKEGKGLIGKTRNNALFLSVVAQFNGKIATDILGWFRVMNIISGLEDLGLREFTIKSFENNTYKEDIIKFVKKLDVGIDDIQIEKTNLTLESLPKTMPDDLKNTILKIASPDQRTIGTIHKVQDANLTKIPSFEIFDIDKNESEGTKKLFALAGPLIDTLRTGKVLIIDEFDARLHPIMTRAIINLFNSKKNNPKHAQVVFVTHDTNLLSNKLFRRDQIWFTEKDKKGSTHLYSLVEYKVRNDATYQLDYIRGKYGAIPFIGDIHRVIN